MRVRLSLFKQNTLPMLKHLDDKGLLRVVRFDESAVVADMHKNEKVVWSTAFWWRQFINGIVWEAVDHPPTHKFKWKHVLLTFASAPFLLHSFTFKFYFQLPFCFISLTINHASNITIFLAQLMIQFNKIIIPNIHRLKGTATRRKCSKKFVP